MQICNIQGEADWVNFQTTIQHAKQEVKQSCGIQQYAHSLPP